MPYKSNTDLPASVIHVLPEHAQDIYREAFNHAFEEYKEAKKRRAGTSREQTAYRVAWAAVKKKYHKVGGKWQAK